MVPSRITKMSVMTELADKANWRLGFGDEMVSKVTSGLMGPIPPFSKSVPMVTGALMNTGVISVAVINVTAEPLSRGKFQAKISP